MDKKIDIQLTKITNNMKSVGLGHKLKVQEYDGIRQELQMEVEYLSKENKRLQFLLKDAISTSKNLREKVIFKIK